MRCSSTGIGTNISNAQRLEHRLSSPLPVQRSRGAAHGTAVVTRSANTQQGTTHG